MALLQFSRRHDRVFELLVKYGSRSARQVFRPACALRGVRHTMTASARFKVSAPVDSSSTGDHWALPSKADGRSGTTSARTARACSDMDRERVKRPSRPRSASHLLGSLELSAQLRHSRCSQGSSGTGRYSASYLPGPRARRAVDSLKAVGHEGTRRALHGRARRMRCCRT
jgi:hypothetical protein